MSLNPRPEPVAQGVMFSITPKVLGLVALFVRLAIGISLLNIGLGTVMVSAAPGFGGPIGLPGLDLVAVVLPYATLAIGVGLVFGIFTTVCALLACGLVLLLPLAITYQLVIAAGVTNTGFSPYSGMMGFGRGPGPTEGVAMMCVAMLATPGFVALVLLSAPTINRYSFDALMFARMTSPVLPPPEPPPRPDEASDMTIRDVTAPG